jgi:hypothetical protein
MLSVDGSHGSAVTPCSSMVPHASSNALLFGRNGVTPNSRAENKMYLGAVFILPMPLKGGSGSPVRPVVIGHPND